MKYELRVKFPCGYEYFFKYRCWANYAEELPEMPKECPLHGKKCKPTQKRRKENE